MSPWPPRDTVALVLALALTLAVVGVFIAIVVTIATRQEPPLLGENTAQVLSTLIGGIIGVLGAYLGSRRD